MKRLVPIVVTALVLIVCVFILTNDQSASQIKSNPKPVDILSGDSDYKKQREQWIETLHRAAPGVDWRVVDEATRERKYLSKLDQLQEAFPEGRLKNQASGFEMIANGVLTGNWIEKGSKNLAGRMHCVDIDFENNLLYGASSGGNIWVGTPGGENWTCLTDHKQVKNVQFLRVFKNDLGGTRIMMAPRGTLKFYYSDDMGVTWILATGMENYTNGGYFIRGLSKPDGTIYILANRSGTNNYLFRSTDLGESFTRITRMNNASIYSDIWTNRFWNGAVYYLDRNKTYRLNELDEMVEVGTVNLTFSNSEIKQVQLAGCSTDTADFLYGMYKLEKSTRFFGSDNNGTSWSYRGDNHERAFMSNSFGVSNTDPMLLGFGGVNAYSSHDGGVNWRAVNSWGEYYGDMEHKLHADIPEIEFFLRPNGTEFVWISTDGGTYVSEDGMNSVTNVSLLGLNVSQYYTTYTNRDFTNVIYAGSQDQGFQRSTEQSDGLVNFQQTISGDYGHIVSSDRGNSLWTVYPGFAMRYPEATSSLYNVRWDFSGSNHFWMPPLMEDPYSPVRVYLAGGTSTTGNHLWLLEDKGGTISVVELPYDFSSGNENHRISAMAYSPINKDYRYVLNSGGRFYFSTDRGTSWTKSTTVGPGSHYFYGNSIITSPVDINQIYIGGSGYSGYSVWSSNNGGATFEPLSEGLPNTLVFEMAINEDGTLLFAATEVGPYVYVSSEEQWFDLAGISAPDQTYWSVDFVAPLKTARFGTYGRGIWDFKIASYTSVDQPVINDQDLARIYPNPFTDHLILDLNNSKDLTDLAIYTIEGRLILHETVEPGVTSYQWAEKNIPEGVYIIKLVSGKKRQTLMVIKRAITP